jgi:hypothetical protein
MNLKLYKSGAHRKTNILYFDYFYQQMHQDKFVTVFFIERVPQYVFRQLYCHHQGDFVSALLHIYNVIEYGIERTQLKKLSG